MNKKMNKKQIKASAEINATYMFDIATKLYGEYIDEYIRHFYNKLAELRSGIGDSRTCNRKRNNNSKDNEPCCRCNSRQTNADRIRNMTDKELAEFIVGLNEHCLAGIGECDCREESTCDHCMERTVEWLQLNN